MWGGERAEPGPLRQQNPPSDPALGDNGSSEVRISVALAWNIKRALRRDSKAQR